MRSSVVIPEDVGERAKSNNKTSVVSSRFKAVVSVKDNAVMRAPRFLVSVQVPVGSPNSLIVEALVCKATDLLLISMFARKVRAIVEQCT